MRKIRNGQSVSRYVDQFSNKTGDVFQNQRIVSHRKQDTWTDAVRIFKISLIVLEIWGKIGNGQSVSKYVRMIFPITWRVFQNQRIVSLRERGACTDAVWTFKISPLNLEIWRKSEMSACTDVRNIRRSYLKIYMIFRSNCSTYYLTFSQLTASSNIWSKSTFLKVLWFVYETYKAIT